MGNVRAYDPDPVIPANDVKLTDFVFKLIQVEAGDQNKKNFTDKYIIKVPTNIRSRYSDDVIFGGEWRQLLKDFDQKPLS